MTSPHVLTSPLETVASDSRYAEPKEVIVSEHLVRRRVGCGQR
jgi:hypothetical protein